MSPALSSWIQHEIKLFTFLVTSLRHSNTSWEAETVSQNSVATHCRHHVANKSLQSLCMTHVTFLSIEMPFFLSWMMRKTRAQWLSVKKAAGISGVFLLHCPRECLTLQDATSLPDRQACGAMLVLCLPSTNAYVELRCSSAWLSLSTRHLCCSECLSIPGATDFHEYLERFYDLSSILGHFWEWIEIVLSIALGTKNVLARLTTFL